MENLSVHFEGGYLGGERWRSNGKVLHRSKSLLVTIDWPRLVQRISTLCIAWKHWPLPPPPCPSPHPSASVPRTLGQSGPQRWLEKWCSHSSPSTLCRIVVVYQLLGELGSGGTAPFHCHFSQEHRRPGRVLSSGLSYHTALNNDYLGGEPRPLSKVTSCISEEWYILCEMLLFTSLRSAKTKKSMWMAAIVYP